MVVSKGENFRTDANSELLVRTYLKDLKDIAAFSSYFGKGMEI